TLLAVSARAGGPSPPLVAALRDPIPARRAAAGLVVGRWGGAKHRAGVRRLLRDGEAIVRLRTAQGLLAARDAEAVPPLLDLLAAAPEWSQQAEDSLACLAPKRGSNARSAERETTNSGS